MADLPFHRNFNWIATGEGSPEEGDLSIRNPRESKAHKKANFLLTQLFLGHRDKVAASSMANKLLDYYGSVAGLFAADGKDLASFHSLSAEDIDALKDARAALIEDFCTPTSLQTDRVSLTARIRLALAAEPTEYLLAIYFDGKGRSFGAEIIGIGCESHVSTSPRACVLAAARRCAQGIVIAHNHPGGYAEPSEDDYATTRLLQSAATAMGIRFLDHIIVAMHSTFSFSEHGLL